MHWFPKLNQPSIAASDHLNVCSCAPDLCTSCTHCPTINGQHAMLCSAMAVAAGPSPRVRVTKQISVIPWMPHELNAPKTQPRVGCLLYVRCVCICGTWLRQCYCRRTSDAVTLRPTMLRSCSFTAGSSIPSSRQHSATLLQCSSSASHDTLPLPATLKRSTSGRVPTAGPTSLRLTNDQPRQQALRQCPDLEIQPVSVSRMATSMSPAKPREAQDFQANFGTAVRY